MLSVALKPYSVKLHAVIDQPVAEFLGDLALERLKFGVDEFDDLAGLHIDQVIVMSLWRGFIAGPAIAEIVAIKYPGFLEQAHSAVDRGDRDARIAG